ncbi:MAG: saccharopine dehydrogenase family protein [Candidatus Bathyarchaeota archaeon]|nr:saccharopine dehydrogenase family protein [Candidatus Bathyarchaeota archaeon]
MKMLVLGYGNIGSVLATDLAESLPSIEIVIAGRHRDKAEEAANVINRENVTGFQLDAHNYHGLVDAMKKFDLVIGTLPGDVGYRSVKAAVDANVDMVDVSYMPENPLTLNEDAIKADVTIVPDCGVAPGLSNMLVGRAVSKLDHVENIHVMVGGLPEEPVPPLGYVITWSVEGLIDEYTRKAKIVENGEVVEVEALTGLEEVEFSGVGKLEGFYTDGLRTLLHTVKGVRNMWEKTLRYPGHVEKIKLLKTLGFFDEHPAEVQNARLPPRKVTIKLLEEKLRRPEIKDILAMKVEVSGMAEGSRKCYVYHLLDHYDQKRGVTAMARTTAYPASIFAQLISQKAIEEKGVIPLEKFGVKEKIFDKILAELEKRRVKIVESLH